MEKHFIKVGKCHTIATAGKTLTPLSAPHRIYSKKVMSTSLKGYKNMTAKAHHFRIILKRNRANKIIFRRLFQFGNAFFGSSSRTNDLLWLLRTMVLERTLERKSAACGQNLRVETSYTLDLSVAHQCFTKMLISAVTTRLFTLFHLMETMLIF